jgi:VanZ family protein
MKTKLLAIAYFVFLAVVVYCADSHAHLRLFSFIRSIPGGDKCGHFLLMGGFTFLLNLSLSGRVVRFAGKTFLIGSILALTLITIEELSQRFIPYRTFDLLDLTADYLGVFVFGRLAIMFCKRRKPGSELATDLHG